MVILHDLGILCAKRENKESGTGSYMPMSLLVAMPIPQWQLCALYDQMSVYLTIGEKYQL